MAISRGQVFQQNPLMETIKQFGNQVNSMMRVYQNQQQIDLIRQKQEEEKRVERANRYFDLMKNNANQHDMKWAGYLGEKEGQDAVRFYFNDILDMDPAASERFLGSVPSWEDLDAETMLGKVKADYIRNGAGPVEEKLLTSPESYILPSKEAREKALTKQVQDVVEGEVSVTTPEQTVEKTVEHTYERRLPKTDKEEYHLQFDPTRGRDAAILHDSDLKPIGAFNPQTGKVTDLESGEVLGEYRESEDMFIPIGEKAEPAPASQARFPQAQALVNAGYSNEQLTRARKGMPTDPTGTQDVDAVTRPASGVEEKGPQTLQTTITETVGGETYSVGNIEGGEIKLDRDAILESKTTYENIVTGFLQRQNLPTDRGTRQEYMQKIYALNRKKGEDFDTFARSLHNKDALQIPYGAPGTPEMKIQTTEAMQVNKFAYTALRTVDKANKEIAQARMQGKDLPEKAIREGADAAIKVNRVAQRLGVGYDPENLFPIIQQIVGGRTRQETMDNWRAYAFPNAGKVAELQADADYINALANMRRATSGTSPEQMELKIAETQLRTAEAKEVIARSEAQLKEYEVATAMVNPELNPLLGQANEDKKYVRTQLDKLGINSPKDFKRAWTNDKLSPEFKRAYMNFATTYATLYPNHKITNENVVDTFGFFSQLLRFVNPFDKPIDRKGTTVPILQSSGGETDRREPPMEDEEDPDVQDQISRDLGL